MRYPPIEAPTGRDPASPDGGGFFAFWSRTGHEQHRMWHPDHYPRTAPTCTYSTR